MVKINSDKILFPLFEEWQKSGICDIDFLTVKFSIVNSVFVSSAKANVTVFTHYIFSKPIDQIKGFEFSEKGYEDACLYIEKIREKAISSLLKAPKIEMIKKEKANG